MLSRDSFRRLDSRLRQQNSYNDVAFHLVCVMAQGMLQATSSPMQACLHGVRTPELDEVAGATLVFAT